MINSLENIDPVYFEYAHRFVDRVMPIKPGELKELLKYCELRSFAKRTVLVQEGEIDNYLNMVLGGLVMKYLRVNKNEVILQLATEGHVIHSEISYLSRTPSTVVLETLEPTQMISIRYDRMEEALDKFPPGERMGRLLLSGMFIKKDELQYARLSKTPRERFFDYMENHPHMLQRVPQKYLASYLNIKPETFSRLKGLIKDRKK